MGIIPGITLNGSQPKKVMVEVEEDVNNKRWLLHTISSDVTWYHYPYPSKKNGASSFQFTCWINIYRYIRNKIRKSFDSSAWMSLWAPAGGGTHIVLNPIRQLMSRWEGVQNLCLSRQHFQKKNASTKSRANSQQMKGGFTLQGSRKSNKLPQKSNIVQWKSMNCRLFTFKRYPLKSLIRPLSPPAQRVARSRGDPVTKTMSASKSNPREKCIAEIFQNMPHAFSFWILSFPRRKEISNFEGSEIVSDLHSGSPPLVEMRSSADAATTAKLHHRSPCKGEKTKKWIRNIGNHVGLRIPYFSTKARHSKQNIFINLKKINLDQSVVTWPTQPRPHRSAPTFEDQIQEYWPHPLGPAPRISLLLSKEHLGVGTPNKLRLFVWRRWRK